MGKVEEVLINSRFGVITAVRTSDSLIVCTTTPQKMRTVCARFLPCRLLCGGKDKLP